MNGKEDKNNFELLMDLFDNYDIEILDREYYYFGCYEMVLDISENIWCEMSYSRFTSRSLDYCN